MFLKDFLNIIITDFGQLGKDEGFKSKCFDEEIKGIIICWMISKKIIDFCIRKNYNLIISHEDLYFPPDYAFDYRENKGILSNLRKEFLEKNRINFIRLHSTIDKHFIFDVFDKICGGEIVVKDNLYRIYSFKNKKIFELAEELKIKFKVSFLRILKKRKKIKRVGCLVGGLGLSINASFIDKIISYNVDTVIAGEVDEYTIRAMDDLNLNIIEIGHEASETPGLITFKNYLKKKIPDIPIKYIRNPYPIKIYK